MAVLAVPRSPPFRRHRPRALGSGVGPFLWLAGLVTLVFSAWLFAKFQSHVRRSLAGLVLGPQHWPPLLAI